MSPSAMAFIVPLLWIVFAAFLIMSSAVGLIIAYHWRRFSASPVLAFFTVAVYAGGCVLLLGIMFGAALTI